MQDKPLVTYEDQVKSIRIARKGSTGSLSIKKLMDPEDTGSISGIVLIAESTPNQEPITPHAHRDVEESMYVITGHGKAILGSTIENMKTFPIRPGACIYIPADYYHIIEGEGEEQMKLVISYFPTDKRGKSHREIATELTNVPLQDEYQR